MFLSSHLLPDYVCNIKVKTHWKTQMSACPLTPVYLSPTFYVIVIIFLEWVSDRKMLPSISGHHKYFILQKGEKRMWKSLFYTSKKKKFFTEISKHRFYFFFKVYLIYPPCHHVLVLLSTLESFNFIYEKQCYNTSSGFANKCE